ncbi:MAG: DUF11 domain-containing protein [Thermoplasmatales archaeon]|nr:DUF11 domain-containing protein [Thermoplasmatales archaeon]
MKKMLLIVIVAIIISYGVYGLISQILGQPPSGWPSQWTLIDTDGNEGGAQDDYRDVQYAYIAMDENYLYLRLCCYGYPNFTQHEDTRYKWFIDLNGDGRVQGGTITGGEYLFFVEDTNDDGIGDVYLLKDLDGDGMFSEWEGNYSGGLITNSSIGGYEIIGKCVLMYISWEAIENPYPFYILVWATDQENPNLEQMPTTDGPDLSDIPFGPFFPPYVYLSIEKSDKPDPVYAGGILNYTIWVNNTVGINLTNVTLVEIYDSNVSFISSTPSPTQGNNTWIFNLSVNSSWSVNISVFVNSSLENNTILHNYANVTYGNLSNLTGIYNETWENTTVISAPLNPNITASKTVWNNSYWGESVTVHSGDIVTFNITVISTGTENLSYINITDILPNSFIYINGSAKKNDTNLSDPIQWGNNISWNLTGPFSNSTWFYITFNVTVSGNGNFTNLANVTAEGNISYIIVYDEDSAYVKVINPSIRITKEAYPKTIHSGEEVTYWLNITNSGDCNLTIKSIIDSQGLTFIYLSGDDGDGILEPGETWIYINITSITSDTFNEVNVTAEDELGYELYDIDTEFVNVINPSISITKEAYPKTIHIGEEVTYWLNITNSGDCNLTIKSIIDSQGLTFIYLSGDDGDGILEPGETWIYINITSITSDTFNEVNVTAEDELGYELYDIDTEFVNVIEDMPNIYDPKIAEDLNGPPLKPGDIIRYTIWINNTGNAPSNDNPGNEFEDKIPACTTYVANSLEINDVPNDDDISDGIGYDAINDKIIWNGVIPPNSSIKISFMVRVNLDATCRTISNQGNVYYDTDGDGINDATQPTDDPNTTPQNDPTNLKLDISPPWSWIVVREDPAQFVPRVCTVNIYADDDVGPWKIFYIIYGKENNREVREGGWNEIITFVWLFTEEGKYTIEYWAIDLAGNEETPHNFETYIVDITPPSVEIHFEGLFELSRGIYYISHSTQISLYAHDEGSGIKKIDYKVDDGNWRRFESPFTLSNGTHEIYLNAYDNVGNRKFEKFVVHVGECRPTTSCILDPSVPDGDNGWYNRPVKVRLEAVDNGSGVAKTFYRLDNEEWREYRESFVIGDGKHVLYFYSIDNAGLREEVKEISLNVDSSPPEILIDKPKPGIYIANHRVIPLIGNKVIAISEITFIVNAKDSGSGVSDMTLYIGEKLVAEGTTGIIYTINAYKLNEKFWGKYEIKIISKDLAGNLAEKEINIFILSLVRKATSERT